jgi:hypothetical protein
MMSELVTNNTNTNAAHRELANITNAHRGLAMLTNVEWYQLSRLTASNSDFIATENSHA